MYDNGRGVPQDTAEAVTWYRLAAEQGDAAAHRAGATAPRRIAALLHEYPLRVGRRGPHFS